MSSQTLMTTINDLVVAGKGILAADESLATIGKRFQTIGLANTEEARQAYRSLLCTTAQLNRYISGVILFEETLTQTATHTNQTLPQVLQQQGIVPGIKVDKGLIPLHPGSAEKITQGLDNLGDRLRGYQAQGARFAKWRNVYPVSATLPTRSAISANSEMLARYAAICQSAGIVPIVEPEVLMAGDHSIERCAEVSEVVLDDLFSALKRHNVVLEHMLLKPSMVTPGAVMLHLADSEQIAHMTLRVFKRCVPVAVPSINFLSGGQTSSQATENLQAINALGKGLWQLSFSYGRALQAPCLEAWQGKSENVAAAQHALLQQALANSMATKAQYTPELIETT